MPAPEGDRSTVTKARIAVPPRLTLYLPHPESRLSNELAHGSAIVGLPVTTGQIRIYYEGNVIGAENKRQLSAFLPTLSFAPAQESLSRAWTENEGVFS